MNCSILQMFRVCGFAIVAAALGGCLFGPYGPVPVVYPNTRTEYLFYRMTPVAKLPTGESIEAGDLCWDGVEKDVPNVASFCRPHSMAIFLRRGKGWQPLSENPRLGVATGYALIPANFKSGAAQMTFIFVQPEWKQKSGGELDIKLMSSSIHDLRTLTIQTPGCGITSPPGNSAPSAYMAIVLRGETIYAILQLWDNSGPRVSNRTTCTADEIYTFEGGSEKVKIETAVFIGDTKADGVMRLATRDQKSAVQNSDRRIYFDGKLPDDLIPGLVQEPQPTQEYGSVPCYAGKLTSLGLACWSGGMMMSRVVRCTYSGTKLETPIKGGNKAPPNTQFRSCEELR